MKSSFATLTEIPEAIRSEYVAEGGKYVLKIEGDHPLFVPLATHDELRAKLSTFRDNNIGLNSTVTQLNEKLRMFEGVTPESITDMKTKLEGFEKGGAKTPAELQTAIDAKLKPVMDKLVAAENRQTELERAAKMATRRSTLVQAAAKVGVREEAIPDFLYRGEAIFNEDVVPVRDGKMVYSTADPTRPLTVEEYANSLRTEAPHLFKPSSGGGANPGAGAPAKVVISNNPLDFGRHLAEIAKGDVIIAPSS